MGKIKGSMHITIISAVVCCFLTNTQAHAERTKLAVLDLDGKGVPKSLTENLTDIVTVSLNRLGVFAVLSRSDIKSMLSFESDKQMLGCSSDTSCLAEIGGALGVALLVSGSVGKVGSRYILNLTLTDTKNAKVVEREQRQVKGTEDALISELENASRFLVRSLLEGKQGFMVMQTQESGAEVEVDGKVIGVTPLKRQVMAHGPHRIRVSKKGFITWAKDIVVEQEKTEIVRVDLIPSPEFISTYDSKANSWRRWAWISGGAGALMAFAGAGMYFVLNKSASDKVWDDYDANGCETNPSSAVCQELGNDVDSIKTRDTVAQVVGWAGIGIVGLATYLFLEGPKPGVYDIYKTEVQAGGLKLEGIDLAPLPHGGAYGGLRFSF